MKRLVLLLVAFLSLVLPALVPHRVAAQATPRQRPNIVLILADDLGYMDIGANNPKTFYETQHIDSLAARGMRFTSGYSACCVCSPTRASIMTGKYPPRTGITAWIGCRQSPTTKVLTPPNGDHLALEEVTIAMVGYDYLSDNGDGWERDVRESTFEKHSRHYHD